ncbi:MAG: hypothetical protein KUL88_04545 [Rhizobium sp.]|nr:hypothetical protein [Rhizobium sp.]
MFIDHMRRFERLFDAEGGGSSGGGGLAGAAATAAGGAGAEGGDEGGWKAPDGLPAEYVGNSADETLAKLYAGFNEVNTRFTGLREKLSKMPAAPEKPEAYAFQPGDNLKPFFGDLAQDPMFKQAQLSAHKYGMSQEQFAGFLSDTFGPMAEQGFLPKPFNPADELKTFATATGLDQRGVASTLAQTETFAKGLTQQLKVPDAMKADVEATLMGLTDTAVGNVILQALSSRMNDVGIRIAGDGGAPGALTAEDLKKLDADPRIDPRNREHADPAKRFDEELRKRYDEAYQRHFPSR